MRSLRSFRLITTAGACVCASHGKGASDLMVLPFLRYGPTAIAPANRACSHPWWQRSSRSRLLATSTASNCRHVRRAKSLYVSPHTVSACASSSSIDSGAVPISFFLHRSAAPARCTAANRGAPEAARGRQNPAV